MPESAPITLSPEHFKALRFMRGLAQTGINALDANLREDLAVTAGEAHDLIARALSVPAPAAAPVDAPA